MLKQSPRVLGRPRHDENAKPTKDIVLETATRLFIKEGYKNISMDDVAKACNVTRRLSITTTQLKGIYIHLL